MHPHRCAPTSLATGSLPPSTFDERAVAARWFFLCALLFLPGFLFLFLTQKFSHFTRRCFSVGSSSLFLLTHSDPIPSAPLSFHFGGFPQLIPDYLLSPQECFAPFGTPVLHVLDFCCFSTKAVNLPLTASFLHSFPCGIRSDGFPATPLGPWLASNWHALGSRFGITECSAVQFLFSSFVFKFRSITFPPHVVS